jgi:hypothetical protein
MFTIEEPRPVLRGVDMSRPNVARMDNYLLDGKDNYASDRSAVWEITEHAPELHPLAHANRDFLLRSVRRLAEEEHVDQFLDLGSGMPIGQAVHRIAGRFVARPRVVYVDNDPVVVSHGRALLDNDDTVVTVDGDVRAPDRILQDPRVTDVIDFGRPVAVLCTAVLHHIRDRDRPWDTVRAFQDAMVPGSALVLTHLCGDHADPRVVADVEEVYARANAPLVMRSRTEITCLFDGFDTAEPPLVDIAYWPNARRRSRRSAITFYGGVAGGRPRTEPHRRRGS